MTMTFRALDLGAGCTDGRGGIHLDLTEGYFEPAEVRGEDDVIPALPGRDEQARQKDRRVIRLEGYVLGIGGTPAARSESWHDLTHDLMDVLDYTLASGTLSIAGPYLGLGAGETRTIEAKCINAIGGRVEGHMSYQRWSIELEAIGNPPDWTGTES